MAIRQYVVGVSVPDRVGMAKHVQVVISEFGCFIMARLGLHDVSGDKCMSTGLIIIQMESEKKDCDALVSKLNKINGVKAKSMTF